MTVRKLTKEQFEASNVLPNWEYTDWKVVSESFFYELANHLDMESRGLAVEMYNDGSDTWIWRIDYDFS